MRRTEGLVAFAFGGVVVTAGAAVTMEDDERPDSGILEEPASRPAIRSSTPAPPGARRWDSIPPHPHERAGSD